MYCIHSELLSIELVQIGLCPLQARVTKRMQSIQPEVLQVICMPFHGPSGRFQVLFEDI